MNTPPSPTPTSACPCAINLNGLFRALEFIKFSHTIFALPFALIAMLVAAQGLPTLRTVLYILLCMVGARTAAMAFNRWADWEVDKTNPRTARRSQLVTRPTAAALVLGSLALFFFGAWQLNPLCAWLSPLAALIVLSYSLMKRLTAYTHAFLGLALAAAPMGAWAAVRGELHELAPWVLAAGVWCWVFGFDLIYATQDIDHDRRSGLHSFPARYGVKTTLTVATALHIVAWIFLAAFGGLAGLKFPYWIALAISAGALAYEHRLSRTGNLDKINIAFFQMNALVGAALLIGTLASLWIRF